MSPSLRTSQVNPSIGCSDTCSLPAPYLSPVQTSGSCPHPCHLCPHFSVSPLCATVLPTHSSSSYAGTHLVASASGSHYPVLQRDDAVSPPFSVPGVFLQTIYQQQKQRAGLMTNKASVFISWGCHANYHNLGCLKQWRYILQFPYQISRSHIPPKALEENLASSTSGSPGDSWLLATGL